MNRNISLAIAVLLLSICSISYASDTETQSVSIAVGGMIIVNCNAEGGYYWLGATVETTDGDYIDLPQKRISGLGTVENVWRWGEYQQISQIQERNPRTRTEMLEC